MGIHQADCLDWMARQEPNVGDFVYAFRFVQ